MTSKKPSGLRAAGTVVVRAAPDGPQVLLVHRDRYADWSLPKGKLHRGEPYPIAAVRETLEETGCRVRLGPSAGALRYEVKGRPKEVRYWSATAIGEPQSPVGTEVDAVEWFRLDEAFDLLQHESERELLRGTGGAEPTVALVIARHGKARSRSKWRGDDAARPLAARGNGEAMRLAALLATWSPGLVVSSPSRRCADTLEPYAAAIAGKLALEPVLSEEHHEAHPGELQGLLRDLAERLQRELVRTGMTAEAAAGAGGAVLCTHRPLLADIADTLGIPVAETDRADPLPTGGCWVVHLGVDGTVAVEEHSV